MNNKLSIDLITYDQLLEAVNISNKNMDVVVNLGFAKSNSTSHKISKMIRHYDIDTSHFKNWNTNAKIPTVEFLVKCSARNNQTIKKRIIKENILPYMCVMCHNTGIHNGMELILQLDHIDGDNTNNEISNLRFLCPNCHTQTPTFGGRKLTGTSRKVKC